MSATRFRYALLGLTMMSLAVAGCDDDDPNGNDTPIATTFAINLPS